MTKQTQTAPAKPQKRRLKLSTSAQSPQTAGTSSGPRLSKMEQVSASNSKSPVVALADQESDSNQGLPSCAKKKDVNLHHQPFHAVILNLTSGEIKVEEYDDCQEFRHAMEELVDKDFQVFAFQGARVQFTKPPFRYIRFPDGGCAPLFKAPQPGELEIDENGILSDREFDALGPVETASWSVDIGKFPPSADLDADTPYGDEQALDWGLENAEGVPFSEQTERSPQEILDEVAQMDAELAEIDAKMAKDTSDESAE